MLKTCSQKDSTGTGGLDLDLGLGLENWWELKGLRVFPELRVGECGFQGARMAHAVVIIGKIKPG